MIELTGKVFGSVREHTEKTLAAVWENALLVVPAKDDVAEPVQTTPALMRTLCQNRRFPVLLFAHGSSGINEAIRQFSLYIAQKIGWAVVVPDSMQTADRLTYSSPVAKCDYEAVHAMRSAELAYSAQRLFEQPSTEVLTVLPERTFWEKVTILHRESFRPEDRPFPLRYSRHYYDLYKIKRTPVKDKSFQDNELLERVVQFKDKFYRCPWARYDLAKRGTMKLSPPEYNVTKLRSDYEHMQNMLFGEKPRFEEIMNAMAQLEKEINT